MIGPADVKAAISDGRRGANAFADQHRRGSKKSVVDQAFEPDALARFGFIAPGKAQVVDEVEMFAPARQARHIRKILVIVPGLLWPGVLARAAQINGADEAIAATVACAGEEHAVVKMRARHRSQQ